MELTHLTWLELLKRSTKPNGLKCSILWQGQKSTGTLKGCTNTRKWHFKYIFEHPGLPGGRLTISLWQLKSTPNYRGLKIWEET